MTNPADPASGGAEWHPDWGHRADEDGPVGERKRWRLPRWANVLLAVVLVGGVVGLWWWSEHAGSSAFCRETVSIRREIAEASEAADETVPLAVAAVAADRAPGLTERAERMSGSEGDAAEEIAAALTEVVAADSFETPRDPLTRFVELDNDFRVRYCDTDGPGR